VERWNSRWVSINWPGWFRIRGAPWREAKNIGSSRPWYIMHRAYKYHIQALPERNAILGLVSSWTNVCGGRVTVPPPVPGTCRWRCVYFETSVFELASFPPTWLSGNIRAPVLPSGTMIVSPLVLTPTFAILFFRIFRKQFTRFHPIHGWIQYTWRRYWNTPYTSVLLVGRYAHRITRPINNAIYGT
jgi:hypothetical protein